jgi:hypothetical protein
MKKLYSFTHDLVKETKVPEKKGDQEVLVKKEEKVPRKFILRKPSRTMIDDSEFFQKKEFNKCVKSGILTSTQVTRDVNNDGGIFSENQKKKIEEVTQTIRSLSERKEELDKKEKKTKKEEEEFKNILSEMNKNIDEIENIQSLSYRVFDNTAEIYTRNKLINWWLVHLLYEEVDEKMVPFFGEGNEDDKFKKYDELEEDEEESFSNFFESLIKRVVSLVVFWYMSEETPDQKTFEIVDPELEKKKTKKEKEEKKDEQKNSES